MDFAYNLSYYCKKKWESMFSLKFEHSTSLPKGCSFNIFFISGFLLVNRDICFPYNDLKMSPYMSSYMMRRRFETKTSACVTNLL